MDITFLGHSSFRIKGKPASVVTDPFDPTMVGLKYSAVEGDIVTISHHHRDHDQGQAVKGVKKVIDSPGEYEIMGVSILGFASYHDDKKGEERGENTIFVYEIDGIRLAHLGDLGHKLSEEMVDSLGDIDIMMIPVGGTFTISPVLAAEIVRNIEPTVILPMHYLVPGMAGTFSGLAPVEEFLKEVGSISERLPRLSIKKEELGEEQKIVILEKK
jgi:L-ascorbate metabolism protein UlaG (beta-lactamase superfamily)